MANASLPCRTGSMTESCPSQKLWNLKYDFKASFAFKYAIQSTLSKPVSLVKLTSGQLVLVQSHWLIILALYRASTIHSCTVVPVSVSCANVKHPIRIQNRHSCAMWCVQDLTDIGRECERCTAVTGAMPTECVHVCFGTGTFAVGVPPPRRLPHVYLM